MNKILQPLIDIAVAQIGSHEEGGNNIGPKIIQYQLATWLDPAAWSWCAAFQCWCMREWLHNSKESQDYFNLKNDAEINLFRCRDASAFGWINWAKKHGLYITDEKEQALAADIVVYEFSHIGIVIEDQLPGKDYIVTCEGNTNGNGQRDSETGDGVWQKNRKTSLVRNYIRLIKP